MHNHRTFGKEQDMERNRSTTETSAALPFAAGLFAALLLVAALLGCNSPVDPIVEDPVPEKPTPQSPAPAAPAPDPWAIVKSWQSFESLEAMDTFLAAASDNTPETPYGIRLSAGVDVADFAVGIEPADDKLGNLFAAFQGKYVALDLSQCTGTEIADSTLKPVRGNNLVLLKLPDGLTKLGNYSFYNNNVAPFASFLVSVTFPVGLESIGDYAFYHCFALVSAHFPQGLKTIGANAFDCTALVSVELPEGIEEIKEYAFAFCYTLETVTLPAGLITIGQQAFTGDSLLRSIHLPHTLTSIGLRAFEQCKNITFTAAPAGGFEARENGKVLVKKDGSEIIAAPSLAGDVVLSGYDSVAAYAFYGNTKTTGISFGEGLVSVGDYAFYGNTQITGLSFGEGLVSVEALAFESCNALETLDFPSTLTRFEAKFNSTVHKKLTSVTIRADTPPTRTANASKVTGLIYYVPAEAVDAYKSASYWSYAASNIQAIPED
jgi:hypothetical protein